MTDVSTLASGYVRLSNVANPENLSADGMAEDIRALAAAQGLTLTGMYFDNGVSGAVRDRPDFIKWLDDARAGRVGNLLTMHGDRLTREGINAAALLLDVIEGKNPQTGKVERTPVRFMDCSGLDSRDQSGFRWRFIIAAEVAREELQRITARNRATQARLLKTDRFRGGRVPYGYQVAILPEGGKTLVIDPDEAPFIREAMERILRGESLYSVTRWLNDSGSVPHNSKAWGMSSVRWVLVGHSVLGQQVHRGLVMRDDEGMPKVFWPPIMTADEQVRVRAALDGRQVNNGERHRRHGKRMLSGWLQCATCGGPLALTRTRPRGSARTYDFYRCNGRSNSGRNCQAQATIAADFAEEVVAERLLSSYGHVEIRQRVILTEGTNNAELAQVELALRDYTARMMEDLPEEEEDDIREKVSALKARRKALNAMPSVTERVESTGETVGSMWVKGDVASQRNVLGALFGEKRIVIERGVGAGGTMAKRKKKDPTRIGPLPLTASAGWVGMRDVNLESGPRVH